MGRNLDGWALHFVRPSEAGDGERPMAHGARTVRGVVAAALVAALASSLSACTLESPQPDPIDLQRVWTDDSGGMLDLRASKFGTFRGIPWELWEAGDTVDVDDLSSGKLERFLGDTVSLRDLRGWPVITLDVVSRDGRTEIATFSARKGVSGWRLVAEYGDIDHLKKWEFTPSECDSTSMSEE